MSGQLDFKQLETAVMEWARESFLQDDIAIHIFHDDNDDPDRFIAFMAVRGLDEWQAAEVWLEVGQVVSINDLGEGVPPEGVAWPWNDTESS